MSEEKYHYNPDTGRVGPCDAKFKCQFNLSESKHSSSPEEAHQAYEDHMEFSGWMKSMKNKRSEPKSKKVPEYPKELLKDVEEGGFTIPGTDVHLLLSTDPDETWDGAVVPDGDSSTFVEMRFDREETIGVFYYKGEKSSTVIVPRTSFGDPLSVRVYEMQKTFEKIKRNEPVVFG